jgi:hypothetical protein
MKAIDELFCADKVTSDNVMVVASCSLIFQQYNTNRHAFLRMELSEPTSFEVFFVFVFIVISLRC